MTPRSKQTKIKRVGDLLQYSSQDGTKISIVNLVKIYFKLKLANQLIILHLLEGHKLSQILYKKMIFKDSLKDYLFQTILNVKGKKIKITSSLYL